MDKNHITLERSLYEPSYSGEHNATALLVKLVKFYSPQQETQTEREWGPDTSRHQTKEVKERGLPTSASEGVPTTSR
jgi:hypothetical protein